MSHRYLTAAEKDETLATWHRLAESPPASGPGGPDLQMVLWCEAINRLSGICTTQSCAGHGPDSSGVVTSGHLWLRLDQPTVLRFAERAFRLAVQETIESVSLIYQPYGEEVAEVLFRGGRCLDDSMGTVLGFLRSLGEPA